MVREGQGDRGTDGYRDRERKRGREGYIVRGIEG